MPSVCRVLQYGAKSIYYPFINGHFANLSIVSLECRKNLFEILIKNNGHCALWHSSQSKVPFTGTSYWHNGFTTNTIKPPSWCPFSLPFLSLAVPQQWRWWLLFSKDIKRKQLYKYCSLTYWNDRLLKPLQCDVNRCRWCSGLRALVWHWWEETSPPCSCGPLLAKYWTSPSCRYFPSPMRARGWAL